MVYLGSLKITGNRTIFPYFNKRRGNAIQDIHATIPHKEMSHHRHPERCWIQLLHFLYIFSLVLSDVHFCEQSSLRFRILDQNFLYIFYFPI